MRKYTLLLIATLIATIVFSNSPSSFKFVKKTTEKDQVTVYFNLEKDVTFSALQSLLSSVEGVKNVSKSESGYIKVVMNDQTHNNEIRTVILNSGSDIDKKFIVITSKSFYEFN